MKDIFIENWKCYTYFLVQNLPLIMYWWPSPWPKIHKASSKDLPHNTGSHSVKVQCCSRYWLKIRKQQSEGWKNKQSQNISHNICWGLKRNLEKCHFGRILNFMLNRSSLVQSRKCLRNYHNGTHKTVYDPQLSLHHYYVFNYQIIANKFLHEGS